MTIFKSTFSPNSSSSTREWMGAVLTLCSVDCCSHNWDLLVLVIASQKVKFKLGQDFWTSNTEFCLWVDSETCLRIGDKGDEFISDIAISYTVVLVELNLSTLIVTVMREIAISSKTTTGFEFSHVIRADIIEGCFLRWMFLKLILVAYNASL